MTIHLSRDRLASPTRREFIAGAGVWICTLTLPSAVWAKEKRALPTAVAAAARKSALIYVSPLRASGAESQCHGEVWFVEDAGDFLVVTASNGWKARAVDRDLRETRIWVGDFGNWKRADDRYRDAPSVLARASFEKDAAERSRVLEVFGSKYPAEWEKWGPRFRNGLADESRVMIRYRPTGPKGA